MTPSPPSSCTASPCRTVKPTPIRRRCANGSHRAARWRRPAAPILRGCVRRGWSSCCRPFRLAWSRYQLQAACCRSSDGAWKRAFGVPRQSLVGIRLAQFKAHAGDIPLVAESRLGLGRVVLLTFDVARAPFDRWPGMKETWFELLHISETPTPAAVCARGRPTQSMNSLSCKAGTFHDTAWYCSSSLCISAFWPPGIG